MQQAQRPQLGQQQVECINFAGPQLLISGPPGSGKTFVLLARAKSLAEQTTSTRGPVLLFTFNRTLAEYLQEQLRLNNSSERVNVSTYHAWAHRLLAEHSSCPQVISGAARRELLAEALTSFRSRQHAPTASSTISALRSIDWWEQEADWIKGRAIDQWEMYRTTDRTGRGQGLRENARRMVWEVVGIYNQLLRMRGQWDFRDYSLHVLALGTPLPDRWRVDHVLLDEAQDLHYADLQVLSHLARKSTTVVADRTQKIYQTGFTWRDLGFDITGGNRSRVLSQSYRTTRQIAQLAASLQRHETLVHPGDPDFNNGTFPAREGLPPVVYCVRNRSHEAAAILQLLRHLSASVPGNTIGLLAPSKGMLVVMQALLRQYNVSYEHLLDRTGSLTSPGIKLSTFHSAKGLEFDDVVIVGLTSGLFPHLPATHDTTSESESNGDNEEALATARRVLYVAMTRAKHRLYMLHGTPPSQFIAELDVSLYRSTAPELEVTTSATSSMPGDGKNGHMPDRNG